MKHWKIQMLALLLPATIMFTSCEKEKQLPTADSAATQTLDESWTEDTFDEIQEISDQAWEIGFNNFKSDDTEGSRLGDCVTITMDTTVMPRVMTIDFGEENCLCHDGKYRRGQIIVTFTGRPRRPGSVVTHTFQNFYVNDNHVQGTRIQTNHGWTPEGHLHFQTVDDGSVTFVSDGRIVSWSSDKSRYWIEGMETPRPRDDVFMIEGHSQLSSTTGRNAERIITTPLRRELSCRWFVSGIVEITPADGQLRILDYGDGNCDNQATLTIGDEIISITLP